MLTKMPKSQLDPRPKNVFRVGDYPFSYMHWIIVKNNQNIADALRSRGITPLVWRILALLQEQDGLNVTALSERSLIDRALLSRILRILLEEGLLANEQTTMISGSPTFILPLRV